MHAGKTDTNIDRKSSALSGTNDIAENYDTVSNVLVRATSHKEVSSFADEQCMATDLRMTKPYAYVKGRAMSGFKETVRHSGLVKLNHEQFIKWLKLKQLYYSVEIGK